MEETRWSCWPALLLWGLGLRCGGLARIGGTSRRGDDGCGCDDDGGDDDGGDGDGGDDGGDDGDDNHDDDELGLRCGCLPRIRGPAGEVPA